MMMVFALAMSRPVSMMVVETSTSNLRSQKSTTTCSSCASGSWPWATAIRASGTSSARWAATRLMLDTRLCTTKIWPSRSSSRRIAAATWRSEYGPTKVRMGCRSSGGVARVDISRMPVTAISSVRGIGVALIARMSTLVLSFFRASLCSTPNRCSSSMMTSPRSLKTIDSESSRCVPMTMSTVPPCIPAMVSLDSFSVWKRESARRWIGKPAKRSWKVSMCWRTSSVVGTSIATCLPSWIALNAARTATSVLPKPTSPESRRSIGMGRSMSALTSSMVVSWSGVSANGNDSSSSRCQGVSGPNAWPLLAIRADVAADQVELVGGHEQLVARVAALGRRVFEHEVLALGLHRVAAAAGHLALGEFDEPADAVGLVHDVVAGLELQRVDDVLPAAGELLDLPGVVADRAAVELGLADQGEPGL